MAAADNELTQIQAELQSVKKALREGAAYLGMQGEALQRYLLQLNEKENLLLSKQLRSLALNEGPLLQEAAGGGVARGGYPSAGTNGSHLHARPAPQGEPKAFNRDDIKEVISHMSEYEAVPGECAKCLKSLSSLAYKNAHAVGQEEQSVPSLLRVIALHPNEGAIQLNAMRTLCNMAYDQELALKRLSQPDVMIRILTAFAGEGEPKEVVARASEALARIVAAEVKPDSDGGGPPPEKPVQMPAGSTGALCGLYLAACRGEAACLEVVPKLLTQLAANEVMEPKVAAEGFVRSEQECKIASEGAGWLALAKVLTPADSQSQDLPAALVEAGAIRAAAGIMTRFQHDGLVQLTGIEAMSSLVGNRWAGLRAFADVGGMERVEDAMRKHTQDAIIQTKGIRALGSGVQWPSDVQERARYSYRRAVELTNTAMSMHSVDGELQIAALEALSKYLEKTKCVAEVKDSGGEGLVKMMMTSHQNNAKVQQWGRSVLNHVGADPNWAPRSTP